MNRHRQRTSSATAVDPGSWPTSILRCAGIAVLVFGLVGLWVPTLHPEPPVIPVALATAALAVVVYGLLQPDPRNLVLAVIAGGIAASGGLLAFQELARGSGFWVYAWPLIVSAGGLVLVAHGLLRRLPTATLIGLATLVAGWIACGLLLAILALRHNFIAWTDKVPYAFLLVAVVGVILLLAGFSEWFRRKRAERFRRRRSDR